MTMTTREQAPATPAPNTATPTPKSPRSQSVALRSPDGAILRFTAIYHRRDGGAVTYAVHSTAPEGKSKKRTNTRGATETHANVAAAKTAIEKLVAQAVKLGWQRKERASGFRARPDAFDAAHLPAVKTARR